MNAQTKIGLDKSDLAACRHWSNDLPYRAIVPIKLHSPTGPVLYQVAGSTQGPCGGEKALRLAMKIHGANCHYCKKSLKDDAPQSWTLDHVEPAALGGKNDLSNLVIACLPCNRAKGHVPIDSHNPAASREWLLALRDQIEQRLKKLPQK